MHISLRCLLFLLFFMTAIPALAQTASGDVPALPNLEPMKAPDVKVTPETPKTPLKPAPKKKDAKKSAPLPTEEGDDISDLLSEIESSIESTGGKMDTDVSKSVKRKESKKQKAKKKREQQKKKKAARKKREKKGPPGIRPNYELSPEDKLNKELMPDVIYKKQYEKRNVHLPKSLTPDDLERNLFLTSSDGDINGLRALLNTGLIDINARNAYGNSPLMQAALHSRVDTLRLLLARGANPDHRNDLGLTALHIAAKLGRGDMVRVLTHMDANPNIKDTYGNSPLQYAAAEKHFTVAQILLQNGAHREARFFSEMIQNPTQQRAVRHGKPEGDIELIGDDIQVAPKGLTVNKPDAKPQPPKPNTPPKPLKAKKMKQTPTGPVPSNDGKKKRKKENERDAGSKNIFHLMKTPPKERPKDVKAKVNAEKKKKKKEDDEVMERFEKQKPKVEKKAPTKPVAVPKDEVPDLPAIKPAAEPAPKAPKTKAPKPEEDEEEAYEAPALLELDTLPALSEEPKKEKAAPVKPTSTMPLLPTPSLPAPTETAPAAPTPASKKESEDSQMQKDQDLDDVNKMFDEVEQIKNRDGEDLDLPDLPGGVRIPDVLR
jgi:hypothetical protein